MIATSMIRRRTSRRRAVNVAAIAVLATAVAACGDDSSSSDASADVATATTSVSRSSSPVPETTVSTVTATPGATSSDAGAGFPVTIEHKYGSIEIATEPERVVTVEVGKEEYALAVGVVPVGAIRSTFANFVDGLSPWAIEAIGDDPMPELLSNADGLNFEAIAALNPDLIIGTEGLTSEEYETLSQIAPTLAQPADYDDFTAPWREQARMIGDALGRGDEMSSVIADIDAGFADAIAEHPDFDDSTAVFAGDFGDGQVYAFDDYRADFFRELGLELPDTITPRVAAEPISNELLHLIEADAVLMALYADDRAASIEADAVFTGQPMFDGGHVMLISGETPTLSAINFSTPLSLPVALDRFVPVVAALIDGDPATEPPALSS